MEYTLKLSLQEIQILGQALLEVPTKFGMPLLEKLQKEVTAQTPKTEMVQPQEEVEHAA